MGHDFCLHEQQDLFLILKYKSIVSMLINSEANSAKKTLEYISKAQTLHKKVMISSET